MDHLQTWDALKTAIEKAHSISELKIIRNQAESIRYALRQAGESQEMIRKAEIVKLRAERRAGEVLLATPKQGRGEYQRLQGAITASYRDLGIEPTQAFRWQSIAKIPIEHFEQWLQTAEEVSTSGALRLAKTQRDWTVYHIPTRSRQAREDTEVLHPDEKAEQIRSFLPKREKPYTILELFAGGQDGNLSKVYQEYGTVDRFDKKLGTGDSYLEIHRLIHEKRTYDVVDLDPYGAPNRMFPHVYLLIENGYLFLTFPKPHVNVTNRMNEVHQESFFGVARPTIEQIVSRIVSWGLCHWRKVELIDVVEFSAMWRFMVRVSKVKATEYVGY